MDDQDNEQGLIEDANFQYKTRRLPQTRGVISGREGGGTGSIESGQIQWNKYGDRLGSMPHAWPTWPGWQATTHLYLWNRGSQSVIRKLRVYVLCYNFGLSEGISFLKTKFECSKKFTSILLHKISNFRYFRKHEVSDNWNTWVLLLCFKTLMKIV